MAQELYKLPKGWEWSDLNSACSLITDGAHASPKSQFIGKPYITVRDIDDAGNIDLVGCKKISTDAFDNLIKGKCGPSEGSVLFSKDGTVGKVALVKNYAPFVVLSSLAILEPKSDQLIPEYLRWFMLSPELQEHAIGNKTGAAIKRIVLRTIKTLAIPLPPLNEQKRIVAKLNALFTRIDAAITHLQQTLELSKALFASAMKSEVSGDGHDWACRSLNSLGNFSGGGTPSKSKSEYWNGEILWITPKDMKSWEVSDSQLKVTHQGVINSSAKVLPPNSVLIVARSGILRHTLPVCINRVEATVNQDIKVFIPGNDVTPEYMQYLLKGHENLILSQLVKGGVTVESLKYKEFQDHVFPVPPIVEQKRIVDHLDALSERTHALEASTQEKTNDLTALKASLLDAAFKGRL